MTNRFGLPEPPAHRLPKVVLVTVLSLGLAVGLASCTGEDQRGSPAHRLSEWVSGTGLGGDIGTLIADNVRIPREVPNGTGAMHAGCGALLDDAEAANGELPTPDSQVTDWLSQAYGLEGTAATDCYKAGVTDPALLTVAERDTIKAEALMTEALTRISDVDGQTVSTTTTTDSGGGSIFG
jgi:hypothetical protein